MKLKYYLRGLGMGIFVTALILIIAHNVNDGVSDAEIIRRAKALGMVMSTEDNLFSDETSTADKNNETTTENQSTEDLTTEPSTTEAPTTEEPTTEEPTTEEPTTEEPTTEAPTTEATPTVKEFTFTVERGMFSEAVTRLLVQGGIITNEAEFNQYLSDTGYDEKIQTGVFTVNSGMSYEEIAKILSKNR